MISNIKLWNSSIHFYRYRLAGAICPQNAHFTATIVRGKDRFSKFDDAWRVGVKDNDGGNDFAETAIYTIELNNE